MSGVTAMPNTDSDDSAQAIGDARRAARRENFKLITQHVEIRDITSVIGGEGFVVHPRKRFDCMAVVRGAAWAAVCVRTRYGDAAISRMQTGDGCFEIDEIIKLHETMGAWIAHDQIWLSRDEWGPKSDEWSDAADFLCFGDCLPRDGEEAPSIRSDLHMVGLETIEKSFGMPITRIADAAREGRLGRIQDLVQLDRAQHAAQREDLSNLEASALAMCVYAQAGDE